MSEVVKQYLTEIGAPATLQRIIKAIADGMCEDKFLAPKREQIVALLTSIMGYDAVEDMLMEVVSSVLTEEDMLEIISLRRKYPVLVKAMGAEYQTTIENMYKKRLNERFQEKKSELDALVDAAYDEGYAKLSKEKHNETPGAV